MVIADSNNPTLGDAAGFFLSTLSPEEREMSQQEVSRFVRWYGRECSFTGLRASEIANYAERLSLSDTDYPKKLELIRAFLSYVKKRGWSKTNLGTHLKTKKTRAGTKASDGKRKRESIALTQQGQSKMEAELAELKDKRLEVIDEMQKAAADKDFRENAPLAAAREQRGYLEGRIQELEETLKAAVSIDSVKSPALKVHIGSKVCLSDLTSSEELLYMIVSPKEVDVTRGMISSVSPIGKALIGRGNGDIIEVTVPAGKLRYQIKSVER